ncbi:hypothetical protein C2G38_2045404 [Gigaspora rosea]|uniref:Uncharacterized protein n=1 Tax=Gigaspora rosea TaxID=44941 RepID=A0A397ULY1_9GLOM|nr:hypothetical protein C2G38_2045404 [Gigaspora rosea]
MVIDFIAKRNEEGKEDLEPGRFYYYIITHPDSNINIGRKMRLVSEFKDTDEIDKLYYFKNIKDICASFFACSAKAAAEKIEKFYKEQIDSFKQTTISFPVNAQSSIKKRKSEIQINKNNSVEKTVRKRLKKTQKGEYICNSPFSKEKLVCVKERDIEKRRCENCHLLKKCGLMCVFNGCEKLKWFRENKDTNYHRPMMFPDNNGHIVEYRQIKITKDINIMVDSKFRSLLKNYKLFVKKEEIYYDQDKYLLELLFPNHKRENMNFKNKYIYDFREYNIEFL